MLQQLMRPFHWLVAGLLIGGEKKKSEKARIRKGLSVVVGTVGRLADHMSSTEAWNLAPIQFFIMDEVHRHHPRRPRQRRELGQTRPPGDIDAGG